MSLVSWIGYYPIPNPGWQHILDKLVSWRYLQLDTTVVQSGMATQEAVDRSITSVVGPLDAAGRGHLQDAQTGADIR